MMGDHASAGATCCFSELPQANPSILALGLPPREDPQVGDPVSTIPACFMRGEFPSGEEAEDWACLANCTSWTTGLLVRTGGEPQMKPTWLLESGSLYGSFWQRKVYC